MFGGLPPSLWHFQILLVSLLQVGKHGIIIEFSDPDYNTRRSATYLPEVAAHEGNLCSPLSIVSHLGSEVSLTRLQWHTYKVIIITHKYFIYDSKRKLITEKR